MWKLWFKKCCEDTYPYLNFKILINYNAKNVFGTIFLIIYFQKQKNINYIYVMYVFFFFLSDESSNIYNKIINGSKIMKHNFIILRKYLKIFWWKKKKNENHERKKKRVPPSFQLMFCQIMWVSSFSMCLRQCHLELLLKN